MSLIQKYCSKCGGALSVKLVEEEGLIPFCDDCQELRFPTFSTAMSTIVLNPPKNKILLIKQGGRQQFVLVAGYVTLGEAVETTVRREVLEEVGLKVTEERFLRSSYYEKTNTLMLNFESVVSSEELTIKVNEVDEAQWFTFSEAKAQIIPNSLAECFLLNFLKDLETN